MYEYRTLTPEQQKAVVEARRARGFPLHRPPHVEQGDGWYLITAATFEHRHHFPAPKELTALERRLLEGFAIREIPCAAWVVFPNHYHVLVKVASVKKVGPVLGPVHGRSSRYANLRDGVSRRRVWCRYSDRKVRSERHFWACVHYILGNPVKHGYVEEMAAWPWSSIHELLRAEGEEWLARLQEEYPLYDFGAGWDD
jgi:putative transposase